MYIKKKLTKLNKTISPNDDMNVGDAQKWYYEAGENGLDCILNALGDRYKDVKSILDIPCGYGRVLRYLAAYFYDADIVACDLNHDAVDFCASTFNVKGVYSDTDLSKIDIGQKFDLIWCGSLLTHFSEKYWDAYIDFIESILNDDGVFVFTAHGRIAAYLAEQKSDVYGFNNNQFIELIKQYQKTGFGYVSYSSLHPSYGISLSSPSWVINKILRYPNLKIASFRENAWGHHDVYAISKTAPVFITFK